jgi:ATP-dependent RNA helicase SUPV3L1/SUV3
MLSAEVTQTGDLVVEGQKLGRMEGFRFAPDPNAGAEAAKVASLAVAGAVAREAGARAARLSEAVDASLILANDGAIRWLGDPVAKLVGGEKLLQPRAVILADEAVTSAAKEVAQRRIDLWLAAYVRRTLGALLDLEAGEGLEGAARGVAFQLADALGVLDRGRVAQDVKGLDQNQRGALRKLGVRFGAYYLYLPGLLKPAPRALALQLWALKNERGLDGESLTALPQFAAAGRTSFLVDKTASRDLLRVAGFRLCGDRAVRVDILERLADLIRPAVSYRPGASVGPAPAGAADGDGFIVTVAMTSLTGCSGEALGSILRAIGFESRRINGPALTVPPVAASEVAASVNPSPESAEEATSGEASVAPERAFAAESAEASAIDAAASDEATAPVEPEAAAGDGAPCAGPPAAAPSDEALAEPQAEPTAGPEASSGQAPVVEETLIEVWRPIHRRRRDNPTPRRSLAGRAAPPQARRERRGRADNLAPRIVDPRVEGSSADTPPAQSEQSRGERTNIARPEHFSKKPRGKDARADGPPKRPAPRERPVDPDSPFAKLLALKTALEAKQRGE